MDPQDSDYNFHRYISSIMDIVGKTVDNVDFDLVSNNITLYFTDGSYVIICPTEFINEVIPGPLKK